MLQQPSELRFRSLRRSNTTLATKVLLIPGAEQLLYAVGYADASAEPDTESDPQLRLPAASFDEPLLRQAVSGLDRLVDTPTSNAASLPMPPLGQAAAGTPVTLRTWDARFRRHS